MKRPFESKSGTAAAFLFVKSFLNVVFAVWGSALRSLKNFKAGLQEFCGTDVCNPKWKFPEGGGAIRRGGGKLAFTLIELLVSAACKIGVLPLYSLKKSVLNGLLRTFTDGNGLQCSKNQKQGSKEFCGSKTFDPNQKFLKGSVGFQGSEGGTFFKKSPLAPLRTHAFTFSESSLDTWAETRRVVRVPAATDGKMVQFRNVLNDIAKTKSTFFGDSILTGRMDRSVPLQNANPYWNWQGDSYSYPGLRHGNEGNMCMTDLSVISFGREVSSTFPVMINRYGVRVQ